MAEMNDQLQQRLVTMLDYLGDATKQGAAFVADQAPLVVQEYIRWYFWAGMVRLVVYATVAIVAAIGYGYVWRKTESWPTQPEDSCNLFSARSGVRVAMAIVCAGFLLYGFSEAYDGAWYALRATTAPRVVVIEWCHDQLKK